MTSSGQIKASIKSVILSKNRSLKQKFIKSLINSGYAAEKFACETMVEAVSHFGRITQPTNFIFDATPYSGDELLGQIELFRSKVGKDDIRTLIYLERVTQTSEMNLILSLLPDSHVYFLPLQQTHFNQGLNRKNGFQPPKSQSEPISTKQLSNSDKIIVIEASLHIRQTVELINSVAKNRSRLDIIRQIGQIFNGIGGTFGFFGKRVYFIKVRDLALVIDGISRAYADASESDSISDQHWELLRQTAVTLYSILKELRDNQPINPEHLQKADDMLNIYKNDENIRQRNHQTQHEIDEIFAQLAQDDESKAS